MKYGCFAIFRMKSGCLMVKGGRIYKTVKRVLVRGKDGKKRSITIKRQFFFLPNKMLPLNGADVAS